MQFPKTEKYKLAEQMENTMAELMHLTIRMKKKYHKKTTLQDIDVEVDYMRSMVKMCDNLKYISHGKMNEWLMSIDEAGKIVGGLIKHFSA